MNSFFHQTFVNKTKKFNVFSTVDVVCLSVLFDFCTHADSSRNGSLEVGKPLLAENPPQPAHLFSTRIHE